MRVCIPTPAAPAAAPSQDAGGSAASPESTDGVGSGPGQAAAPAQAQDKSADNPQDKDASKKSAIANGVDPRGTVNTYAPPAKTAAPDNSNAPHQGSGPGTTLSIAAKSSPNPSVNTAPSSKTELWVAISLEDSANAAALIGIGRAANFGNTLVMFVNTNTHESFTATYNYSLMPGAKGYAITAGGSLQLGMVFGRFAQNTPFAHIAKSYTADFGVNTLGLGPVVGSAIYSDAWNGSSLGISISVGNGATFEHTYYNQTGGKY